MIIKIKPKKTIKKKDVKFWFEYLFHRESLENSTLRCRICYRDAEGMYRNSGQIPKIVAGKGTLRSNKNKNGELPRKHANDEIHNLIIKRLSKNRTKKLIEHIKTNKEKQTPSLLVLGIGSRVSIERYFESRRVSKFLILNI